MVERWPFKPGVLGSSPSMSIYFHPVPYLLNSVNPQASPLFIHQIYPFNPISPQLPPTINHFLTCKHLVPPTLTPNFASIYPQFVHFLPHYPPAYFRVLLFIVRPFLGVPAKWLTIDVLLVGAVRAILGRPCNVLGPQTETSKVPKKYPFLSSHLYIGEQKI